MATGFRALVTDLDGVLCDTESVFVRAVNALLREEGLVELTLDEARLLVGLDNESWWRALSERSLRLSLEEYTTRADILARALMERELTLAPGVRDLLQKARRAGMPVALASSAARAYVDFRLRLLGLRNAFDAVITRDDIQHPKPHPEVYLTAARALGVTPAQAFALEDSPTGIKAARAAGPYTVAVQTIWTRGLDLSEADEVIDSLGELDLALLGALSARRR